MVDQTQTSRRLFDSPEAKSLLAALSGVYTPEALQAGQQSRGYLSALAGESGRNPFLEQQIALGDQQAQQLQNTNLAKVRAAGYRGGTGANAVNQALLANDFALGRAANANQMRYQDYNDSFGRRLNAATALAGQGGTDLAGAQNLLNMLAGTRTKTKGTTTGSQSQSSMGIDVAGALGAGALAALAF